MDIILPTRFNNPNLPIVQRPGFADNFERPASPTLGETLNGRPWETYGAPAWSITQNGTATKGAGARMGVAAADGLVANGTLTATLATLDTTAANRRSGVAVRVQDHDNFVFVAAPATTIHGISIQGYVDGAFQLYGEGAALGDGPELASGDTLTVEMNGSQITVLVNGVQALTADVPVFTTVTKHGLFGWAGSVAEWGAVEFTP